MDESETETFWKSKVERDQDKTKPIFNNLGQDQAQDFWKEEQMEESETKTYQ